MKRLFATRPLVLGLHPTSRGFGWAVFENPFTVHSFGIYTARRDKNTGCLKRLTWLLKRFEPEVLVLEAFSRDGSMRSERIRDLCRSFGTLAKEHSADLAIYRRLDVQNCFAYVKAITRDEIAAAVADHLPALQAHLPKRRTSWDSEDKRLSLFAAAALVLTHYQNGAAALLEDMRNAA
jgi:hypothetical protein